METAISGSRLAWHFVRVSHPDRELIVDGDDNCWKNVYSVGVNRCNSVRIVESGVSHRDWFRGSRIPSG
jgi:hypothetical protein